MALVIIHSSRGGCLAVPSRRSLRAADDGDGDGTMWGTDRVINVPDEIKHKLYGPG